jgi:hypothetical protein
MRARLRNERSDTPVGNGPDNRPQAADLRFLVVGELVRGNFREQVAPPRNRAYGYHNI